jgi:hypothetical protein
MLFAVTAFEHHCVNAFAPQDSLIWPQGSWTCQISYLAFVVLSLRSTLMKREGRSTVCDLRLNRFATLGWLPRPIHSHSVSITVVRTPAYRVPYPSGGLLENEFNDQRYGAGRHLIPLWLLRPCGVVGLRRRDFSAANDKHSNDN